MFGQCQTSSSKISSCCLLLCELGAWCSVCTPAGAVLCSSSTHFMVRPGRDRSGGDRNSCGKQRGAGMTFKSTIAGATCPAFSGLVGQFCREVRHKVLENIWVFSPWKTENNLRLNCKSCFVTIGVTISENGRQLLYCDRGLLS